MPGTILENLSGRKLSVLVSILLVFQITCFLIGGLVAPSPAGSQDVIARVCVDRNPEDKDFKKWFIPKTCTAVDLEQQQSTKVLNASNLVLAFQMPLFNYDFSRWQQNLVGVLQIDMVQRKGHKLEPVIELTLDARLAYRNKHDPDDKWTYHTHAEEKRIMDCSVDEVHDIEKDGYPYVCSSVPLFELGSLHHDFYLLNLRLPVDNNKNIHVGHISDIHLHIIYMNGGFTKVWLSLKSFFFPLILGIIIWFWRRVHILTRTPALLEYMLLALGITLAFLDLPIELLTLYFDMPYMLLLSDIRQGIFYGMLLSFWLIFAGEHMLIQDSGERSSLKMYWKHLSAVIIGCFSLLIFDLCERGVQLRNPFYSIWVTPIGTNLALSFIILAGISASMYFIFLCYMIWKVFKNISIKRAVLPSMSSARRLHYEGIIYRFNFLMLATVICAAATIISFILNQVAEGQNKWDENMDIDMSSALYTGIFGMWNVYICAMLMLYAPSHKQWPVESVCGESGEEVEFSRLPTDPSPNEISSLTSFASKASID
ncbi:protein wntless [Agrilus planipennis]|uniref:Protein wntless n=1 Tax=Agrilus planipennis TaxID=224129 RepID=A0A1W4WQF4_AGRPL|nr:protein wntless [Agrilus planipennis]